MGLIYYSHFINCFLLIFKFFFSVLSSLVFLFCGLFCIDHSFPFSFCIISIGIIVVTLGLIYKFFDS